MVHALPALLWFFPLCALEISGFEIICILWLSPVITLIGPIRRVVTTPFGLMTLRLFSLVGVFSYQLPTTVVRLIMLGVGNCFCILVQCATWWEVSKLDRYDIQ